MRALKKLFGKKFLIGFLCMILVGGGLYAYGKFIAPTRIALVNYPEFQVAKIVKANKNPWIWIDAIPGDELMSTRDGANAFPQLVQLVRSHTVRESFGGISEMTLWRWIQYREFPKPTKLNGRNYWSPADIEHWKQSQAA